MRKHDEWMSNGLFLFLWISHHGKPMQGCWTRNIKAPVTSANLKPNYSKCVLKVAKALVAEQNPNTCWHLWQRQRHVCSVSYFLCGFLHSRSGITGMFTVVKDTRVDKNVVNLSELLLMKNLFFFLKTWHSMSYNRNIFFVLFFIKIWCSTLSEMILISKSAESFAFVKAVF